MTDKASKNFSITPGMHVLSGRMQAPMIPINSAKTVEEQERAFQHLLSAHVVDEFGVQKATAARYRDLNSDPCDFLVPMILHTKEGRESAPFLVAVKCPGVSKHGQPWEPTGNDSDKAQFPLVDQGANLRAVRENDVDSNQILINSGFSPITVTVSSSFDGNMQGWLALHGTEYASQDIITIGDILICFSGPSWGSATKQPGAPIVQSVLVADSAAATALPEKLKPLRVPATDESSPVFYDPAASLILLDDEMDEAAGIDTYIITAALPLPEGHGIPAGGLIPIEGLQSAQQLTAKLSAMTRKPAASFACMINDVTDVWVRTVFLRPEEMATHAIACTALAAREQLASESPAPQSWLAEMTEQALVAEIVRNRWVAPIMSTVHQMFVQHFLSSDSNSEAMCKKFRRFVEDAILDMRADPHPFGTPNLMGAVPLFALYEPSVKAWKTAYPFFLFQNELFLSSDIRQYQVNGRPRSIAARGQDTAPPAPRGLRLPCNNAATATSPAQRANSNASASSSIATGTSTQHLFLSLYGGGSNSARVRSAKWSSRVSDPQETSQRERRVTRGETSGPICATLTRNGSRQR